MVEVRSLDDLGRLSVRIQDASDLSPRTSSKIPIELMKIRRRAPVSSMAFTMLLACRSRSPARLPKTTSCPAMASFSLSVPRTLPCGQFVVLWSALGCSPALETFWRRLGPQTARIALRARRSVGANVQHAGFPEQTRTDDKCRRKPTKRTRMEPRGGLDMQYETISPGRNL